MRSAYGTPCSNPRPLVSGYAYHPATTSVIDRAAPADSSGRVIGLNERAPVLENFAGLLLRTASRQPDRTAVVAPEHTCSYAELAGRAGGIAEAIVGASVEPGERVAIFLPRGVEACAAFFGVLAGAAVAVPVNGSLKPRQIEHILDHSAARVLLSTPGSIERLPRPIGTTASMIDAGALGEGQIEPAARIGSDVAQIVYTSGSTGLPKGVALSHANLWAGMASVVEYLRISADDRIASLLPFSFDYGLNQLFCSVGTGSTLVIERSPVPQRIVRTVREREVTVLPAVTATRTHSRDPRSRVGMLESPQATDRQRRVRRVRSVGLQASASVYSERPSAISIHGSVGPRP